MVGQQEGVSVTEEKLHDIIDDMTDGGMLDGTKSELINSALVISDITVDSILTTRVDMEAIDIDDEWDEKEIVERSTGIYELDGDMQVSDFVELLGWRESDIEAESITIGGLTTELYGTFPTAGDTVTVNNAEIHVLEMDGLRVGRVLVTLLLETDEE